jgi:hypothetical protein
VRFSEYAKQAEIRESWETAIALREKDLQKRIRLFERDEKSAVRSVLLVLTRFAVCCIR